MLGVPISLHLKLCRIHVVNTRYFRGEAPAWWQDVGDVSLGSDLAGLLPSQVAFRFAVNPLLATA